MSAEPKSSPAVSSDSVRWIAREASPDSVVPREQIVPLKPHPVETEGGGGSAVRTKLIAIGVAALVLAAIAAILWYGRTPDAKRLGPGSQQSIPLVSVMSPGVTTVTSNVTFTGTIAARYDMPIGIEGDAGRVVAVYVEAGDHVKRGQLLAKLDESVWQPQVNRLAAALEQAKAQAALSAAEYRRAAAVASAGALSAEEIEKRKALSVTDAASVKVAEAMLAESQARLSRTRVLAPADGTVLTRRAEIGQTASPGGEALFRLAASGEIEMRGQVAEQDMAVLKVGQQAQVHLVGSSRPFAGKVRLLGAIIDPITRLGDIRISLAPDPSLRPGAFAQGAVLVSTADRPVLPQTAVLSDNKGSYVYLVSSDNKVVRRDVKVGGTLASGIIISQGLSGSERIVSTAAGFLREGETVQVAAPAATSQS
ncbi:MAG: efflux RND transporter periplasmic adaptor subunit [Sinobacteraceae bacterium]|nr:efflux RND transporter periplasmic adaptor subunit [Nevskiaceae bacterium]